MNFSNDPSKICVAIGFGFFLEMTLSEAITFIDKKSAVLKEKTEPLTNNINRINAHIKLVHQVNRLVLIQAF